MRNNLNPDRTALCGWWCVFLLGFPTFAAGGDQPIRFAADVAPILERHCVRCHHPGQRRGGLSLATFDDLRENEYVVAGDPESSYLIDLVSTEPGEQPRMPPEGTPLSAEQVAVIRQWIRQGAAWPKDVVVRQRSQADASWWSLQSLAEVEPPLPEGIPDTWRKHPIDRFVFARLRDRSLQPSPPADRRTLIRRATYDLTGLPPTLAEVEAFVNDPSADAYERLLDRLLGSPRYGEKWGRHWLDVVRFGESIGFERNVIVNDLWPFRDYVIRSFNADKPMDQFMREHLAGDVLGAGDPEREVGSAFLVAGPYDDVANQDPVQAAQIRANTVDEMIRATSQAFLGLTIGCARCHDHKFDPIGQADYYSFYATFAAVRHGSRVVATRAEKRAQAARRDPLVARRDAIQKRRDALRQTVMTRARSRAAEHAVAWTRPASRRRGTEETFPPVTATHVRLVSEGQDINPDNTRTFTIDEFEIWSAETPSRNVALAAAGAKASGPSRQVEDYPDAYIPELAIDGQTGEQFIATAGQLTIELARPTPIKRVFFSSARGEAAPDHPTFSFVAEYRIEVSPDGKRWTEVANSHDRQPVNAKHRDKRLRELEMTADERARLAELARTLADVKQQLADIPPLPTVWIGTRDADGADGPFHVFLGGNPQRLGEPVTAASPAVLADVVPPYRLADDAPEAARRRALADWIVHPQNPLTPRVLVNRLWHYHFGTGIVDTPSDIGYMGGRPTHPALLDWLAVQLQRSGWRLKPLHKMIMMSQSYRQASRYRAAAARVDGHSRLLWRFPPQRLSAEEIRDTFLMVAGQLNLEMGGPGFRLYHFMQDNVATYRPLEVHGPETYRRAVYHQNARASVVDLLTEFDQPDCALSTPKRAVTTTPLQALTMLNHQFTLDMAGYLAARLVDEAGDEPASQVQHAYALCFARAPADAETAACVALIREHSLEALCRVLLNTSELIYVR